MENKESLLYHLFAEEVSKGTSFSEFLNQIVKQSCELYEPYFDNYLINSLPLELLYVGNILESFDKHSGSKDTMRTLLKDIYTSTNKEAKEKNDISNKDGSRRNGLKGKSKTDYDGVDELFEKMKILINYFVHAQKKYEVYYTTKDYWKRLDEILYGKKYYSIAPKWKDMLQNIPSLNFYSEERSTKELEMKNIRESILHIVLSFRGRLSHFKDFLNWLIYLFIQKAMYEAKRMEDEISSIKLKGLNTKNELEKIQEFVDKERHIVHDFMFSQSIESRIRRLNEGNDTKELDIISYKMENSVKLIDNESPMSHMNFKLEQNKFSFNLFNIICTGIGSASLIPYLFVSNGILLCNETLLLYGLSMLFDSCTESPSMNIKEGAIEDLPNIWVMLEGANRGVNEVYQDMYNLFESSPSLLIKHLFVVLSNTSVVSFVQLMYGLFVNSIISHTNDNNICLNGLVQLLRYEFQIVKVLKEFIVLEDEKKFQIPNFPKIKLFEEFSTNLLCALTSSILLVLKVDDVPTISKLKMLIELYKIVLLKSIILFSMINKIAEGYLEEGHPVVNEMKEIMKELVEVKLNHLKVDKNVEEEETIVVNEEYLRIMKEVCSTECLDSERKERVFLLNMVMQIKKYINPIMAVPFIEEEFNDLFFGGMNEQQNETFE